MYKPGVPPDEHYNNDYKLFNKCEVYGKLTNYTLFNEYKNVMLISIFGYRDVDCTKLGVVNKFICEFFPATYP